VNFENSIKPLKELLVANGFSVKTETHNLIEFSSLNSNIRIGYSPFEYSFTIWIGRNENSLIEISGKVVTECFNDSTFKFQSTLTIENLITFLSTSGKTLLEGDIKTFEKLEAYSFQQARIYNSRADIESADKAWEQKDYANFIKYIDKVQMDLLPSSYAKKYQVAMRKINT
jgi:hypothetical protein